MKRYTITIIFALTAMFLAAVPAAHAQVADVPLAIPYAGHLTDAGGINLNADVQVEVRLYDSLIAGLGGAVTNSHVVYAEMHPAVAVEKGNFEIAIGEGTPLDAKWTMLPVDALVEKESVYLELWVDGERLYPRQRMGAVPAVIRAQHVKYADEILNLGTVTAETMPAYPASKIATGQFNSAQIPNLDASIIDPNSALSQSHLPTAIPVSQFDTAGTLNDDLFDSLDAGMITSGIIDASFLPPANIIEFGDFTVKIGTLAHGQHLNEPSGFESSQCQYVISPVETAGAVEGIDKLVAYLDSSTGNYVCDVYGGYNDSNTDYHCNAYYMYICRKGGGS